MVLHQARRRVGREVIDERLVADVDLIPFNQRGHGNHQGKFLGAAPEIIGHGEHGPVSIPHQHHFGRPVEEFGVHLGHVEPAEAKDGAGEQRQAEQD